MKEEFLHYIWRYGLYSQKSMFTQDGVPVSVEKTGVYNTGAGPDFLDARIRIGSAIWVGHVEIHLSASDWFSHGHQHDPAYNLVILHVVYKYDRDVITLSGVTIPALQLLFDESHYQNFQTLVNTIAPIPCSAAWKKLDVFQVEQSITAMGVERMEERFSWLDEKLEKNKGGWKDLFSQVFFRAFGFGKNQENFDLLAQSIPFGVIEKHASNLFQLESLLFGQAGLLPKQGAEPYPRALRVEYNYLKKKHNLEPNIAINWYSRRTRPANHPVPRLAQLAAWIYDQQDFFSTILSGRNTRTTSEMNLFVSSYWKTHIDFGQPGQGVQTRLGEKARELILINAILPLQAFYERQHGQVQALWDWVEALEDIGAESNYVTNLWKDAGFRIPNAFYSQAFLYMYRTYCVDRRCLNCRLGQMLIKK